MGIQPLQTVYTHPYTPLLSACRATFGLFKDKNHIINSRDGRTVM